jgi:hypothetical protein
MSFVVRRGSVLTQTTQATVNAFLSSIANRVSESARKACGVRSNAKVEIMTLATDDFAWEHLMVMGDEYARGKYPHFLPNEDNALECYRTCAMCPNSDVASSAQHKYVELRQKGRIISDEDRAGAPMPQIPFDILIQKAKQSLMSSNKYDTFSTEFRTSQPIPQIAPPGFMNVLADRSVQHVLRPYVPPPVPSPVVPPPVVRTTVRSNVDIRTDTQNVHDHSVISNTRLNLSSLPEVSTLETDDAVRDVKQMIDMSDLNIETKHDALEMLGSLKDSETSIGVSQVSALSKVWKEILNIDDVTKQKNVKETLVRQMASGVEDGTLVCSTGKISRLIGTLDGIGRDGHKEARPMWAVRDEIARLAAKTRTDSGDEAKDVFRKAVVSQYIDTLGLSESVIEPIITEYEEHL